MVASGMRLWYTYLVDPADHRAEALFKSSVTRDPNNPIPVISKAPALTSLTSACSCRISVPGFRSGHFALLGVVMCQTCRNLYKIILTAQRQRDTKKEQVFKSLLKKHQEQCKECSKGG